MNTKRFAEWLDVRVKKFKWQPTENPPESLKELNVHYFKTGVLLVDSRFVDNVIFDDAETQIKFRAWHEWIHLNYQLEFDMVSEVEAAFRHAAELPVDWHEERMWCMGEVAGHVAHYLKYNRFVDNRREFMNELLSTGAIMPHYTHRP